MDAQWAPRRRRRRQHRLHPHRLARPWTTIRMALEAIGHAAVVCRPALVTGGVMALLTIYAGCRVQIVPPLSNQHPCPLQWRHYRQRRP